MCESFRRIFVVNFCPRVSASVKHIIDNATGTEINAERNSSDFSRQYLSNPLLN